MSELLYTKKNTYETQNENFISKAFEYCEGYKNFLNNSYIERPGVQFSVKLAEEHGFKPFDFNKQYKPGDKFYYVQKERSVMFCVIGNEDIENGIKIIASHIDCPRLDLKPSPLYDDGGIAYLQTHYYGGLRKYQWVTIPLILCGRVYKKDGTAVDICIGKDKDDPIFYITDLLPHLGYEQAAKPLNKEKNTDAPRYYAMKLLNEKYGITEEDLHTAELSFVPNYESRDVGLDRSLIASAGHDDRICCYPALTALFDADIPDKTSVVLFADKEEIGSVGITGMRGSFWYDILSSLIDSMNKNRYLVFRNSTAISADVAAAYDPSYASVYDKSNSADINCGFAMHKYSGHGGKSGASEADPKFMAELRNIFDKHDLDYQYYEMGKVDAGGGGTVSQFIADRNITVVDMGVPILAMHAPYEVASKTDIYNLYLALKAYITEL